MKYEPAPEFNLASGNLIFPSILSPNEEVQFFLRGFFNRLKLYSPLAGAIIQTYLWNQKQQ